MAYNVSVYLMFYGAKRNKIWVEARRRRTVTRYAVLYDVCFSFCLALARPLFCNEQILFF